VLAVPPRSELRSRPLETSRLYLQPLDATDSRELWTTVEASRSYLEPWLPWVPFNIDLDSSARYSEASASDWDASRACRFAIRERANKRFLGVIGLEAFAHLHENTDLGYWLRKDACGKGYMTEAGHAVLDWAFGPVNAHRVRVAAATDNHPSLAVIGRLGFRFEGIARQAERVNGRWLDHAIFSLLVTDPRPRHGSR
jgi:ribosomal-protein-serine acetyltransferase